MDSWPKAKSLAAVPLFPLPNLVLFPRAILPLHIFEERYKAMTADAVEGDGLIAMALLQPGWEKNYYQRPQIDPVVCVGRILSHEMLSDGKYNFLLQGMLRATVVEELGEQQYRQARLRPLEEVSASEDELAEQRRRLMDLLSQQPLARLPGARQFGQMLAGDMPTADIADLLAYSFLEKTELKQSLLADPDVRGRVARIVEAVASLQPAFVNSAEALPVPKRKFPSEPSMN